MTDWFCIRSNIKCERKARDGLLRKGFDVYLPTFKEERRIRRSNEWRTIELVTFPRYLFFAFTDGLSWFDVRSTDGVESVLCGAGRAPVRVPDAELEELQIAHDMGLFDNMRARGPIFEPGVHVTIRGGPFEGYDGVVRDSKAGRYADVLMDILGKQTPVRVSIMDVAAFKMAA
jgi:transcription antitermination factor NusG